MGNNPNKLIHLRLKEDLKKEINNEKNNFLFNCFRQFSSETNHLTKKDLSKLIKINEKDILDELFNIFSSKKEGISLNDLKVFYFSFKNSKFKYILLSFLIFGKHRKILKKNYMNNVFNNFVQKDKKLNILLDEKFLKEIIYKERSNSKVTYFDKVLFIEKSKDLIKKEYTEFEFIKEVFPSEYLEKFRIMHINNMNFICNCLVEKDDVNKNNIDELEQMRIPFNNDTPAVVNGYLYFNSFEKIMTEFRVNKKLIDLIIQYLKCYTMKDHMNFEDFKYLMSNIYDPVSITEKREFLFKMITTIANEKSGIKIGKLIKIFGIENTDINQEETIDLENLEGSLFDIEIDRYLGYMEILGLLPFLRYGVKPVDSELKKKIINYLLNNKTSEEYLIDNFDKIDKFYAINISFWKSIITPGKYPLNKIDNSIIAEEDNIYNKIIEDNNNNNEKIIKKEKQKQSNEQENKNKINENNNDKENKKQEDSEKINKEVKITENKPKIAKLKKDVQYRKDFIIICGEVFQKIKDYFEFDYIIEFPKIIKTSYLKKDENVKEKNKIDINKLELNEKDKYLNYKEFIIDFYPIKTIQFIFSDLLNYIEKERKEKEKIQEDLYLKEFKQLNDFLYEDVMDKKFFEQKMKLLNDKYKDIAYKEEENGEYTKLSKNEFIQLFKDKYNNLIINNKNKIKKESRFKTGKEIIDIFIKDNNLDINSKKINIIYSTEDNPLKEPNIQNIFKDEGIEDFFIILIDIKNKEEQSILSIMESNESKNEKNEEKDEKDKFFKGEGILSKEELTKIKKTQTIREKEIKKQEKLDKLERQKQQKIDKKKKENEQKNKEIQNSEKLQKAKTFRPEKEKLKNPPYGIINFGNTCYFNSINQIFLNLPILQRLFRDKRINFFINKQNKFGYQGKFISAFISLYALYPSEIKKKVYNLRLLVASLKENFNNKMQQDANEYLNFVLEALHEELNIKSSKRYITDKDDNYKYNNETELGNIAWANSLRRNVSFIDSIFMLQLKSNLTCKKCNTKKVNFESSYVLDLPLSLCRMVTVEINLFRLPFKYKIYYDKINKKFSEFLKLNENKNITDILWDYYIQNLNYEQKRQQVVKVCFNFEYERDKIINDLISLLRKVPILELEPENYDINIDNQDISEYKIKHYTELIAYSPELNKIIKPDAIIDKYVNDNDKLKINIYEVLNTNGLNIINNKGKIDNNSFKFNLFLYKIKKKGITKLDDFNNINYYKNEKDKEKQQTNILTLNVKLSYYESKIIYNSQEISENDDKLKLIIEYPIPIVHYHRNLNKGSSNIFMDFNYENLNTFPQQFIIINNGNINKITTKYLYNYVWNLNSIYMNHPNMKTEDFWWNLPPDLENNIKKCYPFVLRIVKRKKNYTHLFECSQCVWYNFCFGCILFPSDEKYFEIKSDSIIFVDWCNSLLKEEIEPCNFESKLITNEEIRKSIESSEKDSKNKLYQSIKDCFDLFFEKESLEDPLYCRVCGGPEDFLKNYEINKLPYILILSLKRFKFNENNNFKLNQLITYPLYNFELGNKIYDLYGVVYHCGLINQGHYISVIKNKNKWVMCDDKNIYETTEDKVMNSNAYILFYISKESINTNTYYNSLKSLMQHTINNSKKKNECIFDDKNNFFKGEPVKTPYGEGYVMEDYIEDFKIEEDENHFFDEKNDIQDNKKNINKIKLIPKGDKRKENIKNEIIIKENDNLTNDKNGMIKIKFDFGCGIINKKNIQKQILENQ